MLKLSVVINTKNAATTLERTLKSVRFADEIIICDMQSSDATATIAQKYTDKIFSVKDVGFADPMRNFALSKAGCPWVLVVDADEEIPETLAKYLLALIRAPQAADAYYVPRKNIIFNKWIEKTGWWPDYQIRFFKNGAVRWTDKVHTLPEVKGTKTYLPAREELAILHHNYQTIEQYLERLNRYTTLENAQVNSQIVPTSAQLIKAFSHELMGRLLAHQGLDEGLHGVGLSFLQAMYQLIVILKRWEQHGFSQVKPNPQADLRQLRDWQRALNYWIADYQIKHAAGPVKLYWHIRRRFKI